MSEMIHRVKQLNTLGVDSYFYSDYVSALEYLEEAANLGVQSAQNNVLHVLRKLYASSNCIMLFPHSKDRNCTEDLQRIVLHRLMELANSGDRDAKRKFADDMINGTAYLRKNVSLASRLYAEAAEAGDTVSIVKLGPI